MIKRRVQTLIALALCCWATAAAASHLDQILGKWIERQPDGTAIVTEFTATTMSSFKVDASGQPTQPPAPVHVRYQELGEAIGVNFDNGDSALVVVKRPDAIVLRYPGLAPHQLTRVEP